MYFFGNIDKIWSFIPDSYFIFPDVTGIWLMATFYIIFVHLIYVIFLILCYKFSDISSEKISIKENFLKIIFYGAISSGVGVAVALFSGFYVPLFSLIELVYVELVIFVIYVVTNILFLSLLRLNNSYFSNANDKNVSLITIFYDKFRIKIIVGIFLAIVMLSVIGHYYSLGVYRGVIEKYKGSEGIVIGELLSNETIELSDENDTSTNTYLGERYLIQVRLPEKLFASSLWQDNLFKTSSGFAEQKSLLGGTLVRDTITMQNLVIGDKKAPVFIRMLSNGIMEIVVGYPVERRSYAKDGKQYLCYTGPKFAKLGFDSSVVVGNSTAIEVISNLSIFSQVDTVRSKKFNLSINKERFNETLQNLDLVVQRCGYDDNGVITNLDPYTLIKI